jgi:pilus assembly protein CpaF
MLQAMNTGHDGSLSTVHANGPRDALARIETMVLMAGFDLPSRAIREQIASALNLVVHIERFRDGIRRIANVTEVLGLEGEVISMQDVFKYDYTAHAIVPTGIRPQFTDRLADLGVRLPAGVYER